MIKIDSVKISAKKNIDLKEYVRESFKIKDTITDFSVIKKSLDAREKEDIKYKISEGKYHMIEMDNFKHFENAMNKP